jgi:predicted patatin/cPLA2 family phospholipase
MKLLLLLLLLQIYNYSSIACNVLSLSGGGSFGALELGILSSQRTPDISYQLMTGVSVGGLNVGYLSYFNNVNDGIDRLKDIYINMKNDDIYEFNFIERNRLSFYDTAPLRRTIKKILSPLTTQVISAIVGSSNLYTGYMDIFNLGDYNLEDKIKVLMTTSAIPIVFPPIEFNNSLYVDGGMISNSIINGIETVIKCNNYNITYISTSSPLPIYTDSTNNITNIYEYTKRVIDVIKYDFNNELAEIKNFYCTPINNKDEAKAMGDTGDTGGVGGIISINYCYPTYKYLYKYSILDFTKGEELFNIGLKYNKCILIKLC